MIDKDKPRSQKRDDYFRCKICKELFADEDCIVDPVKGFLCPKGCEKSFQQPPYQSPLQSDD